jgi:hypothetical protein
VLNTRHAGITTETNSNVGQSSHSLLPRVVATSGLRAESYTTPSTGRGACGVENNVRGVCGLLNKGRVEQTRLSSYTLRARYSYRCIADRSQVMGRVGVRIVREGGVCKQRVASNTHRKRPFGVHFSYTRLFS